MFVKVAVALSAKQSVVSVPATAIIHTSYGNSIYVIEEKPGPDGKPAKLARQQFVRTGEGRGDFVAVVDGLKGGEEVVVAGAFKLRNGAGVVINTNGPRDVQARHDDDVCDARRNSAGPRARSARG